MKKLFIFILLTLLASRLFAEKLQKFTSSEYINIEPTVYISKDGEYEYIIAALTDLKLKYNYCINFRKINTKTEYETRLLIVFETEKQLDNFINKFNLSKIEKEFERIENIAIKNNAYIRDSSVSVLYEFDGSNIKF